MSVSKRKPTYTFNILRPPPDRASASARASSAPAASLSRESEMPRIISVVTVLTLLAPAFSGAQVNPSIRQVELAPFSGQMAVNPDGGAIAVLTGDDAA